MTDDQIAAAKLCLAAAEANTVAFPQIVGRLIEAGFESYAIDYRRATATYFLPNGESIELPAIKPASPVSANLDIPAMQAAIREAQNVVEGYSYKGFCEKAVRAGCAGYVVSFAGRRALYFGRTAQTHTELFPD